MSAAADGITVALVMASATASPETVVIEPGRVGHRDGHPVRRPRDFEDLGTRQQMPGWLLLHLPRLPRKGLTADSRLVVAYRGRATTSVPLS